ncbi:DUF3137 domain-containing protein [Prolixibacteraceae bacterium JC049]|nr:DUF3137 domain-containing protein [Prolixibacteraceae bacterium JC049]
MQKTEELKALYDEKLKGKLQEQEAIRKKIFYRTLISAVSFIGSIFAGIFLADRVDHPAVNIIAFIGIPSIALILFFTTFPAYKRYVNFYKTSIVSEIVRFIHPDLRYQPNGKIREYIYRDSDLFRTRYDKYEGEDLVQGVIDKTDFECSELHTQYKTTTSNGKGQSKTEWHTIFRGLFFHADFNKEFNGRTYVAPDTAEKLFGKWGQKLQKIGGKADLVKLENSEFEKEFVVHSTDQIEARYILTPTMMEAILNLKKEYNCRLNVSFIGSRVYCAFELNEDLFEPNLFRSGVNFKDIVKMYHYFNLSISIIEELNLNNRIWTKN